MSQVNFRVTAAIIGAVTNLRGNDGVLVPPAAGVIDVVGAGGAPIATSGAGSTLTITYTSPSAVSSFFAYANANILGVTGDSTNYTVVFNTEVNDVGGDYDNTTGIFMAPSDGLYSFSAGVSSYNYTALFTSYQLTLFGSVYHLSTCDVNPGVIFDGGGANEIAQNVSGVIPMTAGDTMRVDLAVEGSTKTINILGAAAPDLFTWFSGYKIA